MLFTGGREGNDLLNAGTSSPTDDEAGITCEAEVGDGGGIFFADVQQFRLFPQRPILFGVLSTGNRARQKNALLCIYTPLTRLSKSE